MFDIIGRALTAFYQIGRGLHTVAKHTFRPPTTKEFPDKNPELPGAFRGRLALAVHPQTGEHLCISCLQCERVCPDKCIEIIWHKSPETKKPELIDFRIDEGLCMYCGLCTEVCPTSCIIHTNYFEFSEYSRSDLIYDLKQLTLSQEESAFYFAKKGLSPPKPRQPRTAAAPPPAEEQPPAGTPNAETLSKETPG
jgi:NADH-quinone oxidoreductase subunit I